MKNLSKNQIMVLVVILIILIVGLIYWTFLLKEKEKIISEEAPEIFSMAGIVSKVDVLNNSLIVKPPKEEKKEIKVNLSEDTKIVKLKFPFDPANPPPEATFTPERTSITLDDLEIGDNILIETVRNIYGKTEFDDVTRIQVLP